MMKKYRNESIDFLRLFCSFGVIALHLYCDTPASEMINAFFWPICVPFFYVTSLVYFISNLKLMSVGEVLLKNFKRLLVPYFAWTLIYVMLFQIQGLLTGKLRPLSLWRVVLYGESSVQLYFLPTLFILQILTISVYLLFVLKKRILLASFLLSVAVIYIYIGDYFNCFGVAHTGQIFGFVVYITFSLFVSMRSSMITNRSSLTIGSFLVISSICLNMIGKNIQFLDYSMILPLAGVGLFLVGFGMQDVRFNKHILSLSSLSFGIYLVHIVFLEGMQFLLQNVMSTDIYYNFINKLLLSSVLLVFSVGSIMLIQKFDFAKKYLLGEY